ncbi:MULTISPECIES: hypothetical protein [unclassified Pseudomonas]|uniref:hypothetical protein n=1 Tax=unclassified Pseudomonas TaxID=196821 RepID=UPI00384F3509
MTSNTRSPRQLESLRRIREWHLDSALRAQLDGRDDESRFHMHYYRLLKSAVADPETDTVDGAAATASVPYGN